MKYFVRVNGQEHAIEVTERLGALTVRADGRELAVSYREVDRHGQVALLVDGKSYGASIESDGHAACVTVAGHLYLVELEDERERAAHAAERERTRGGGGVVTSVMPGVVVRLLVAEGDVVEEGQPLLILEAMKMQNEIPASAGGRVERILVEQGQAVASGARLVVIGAQP